MRYEVAFRPIPGPSVVYTPPSITIEAEDVTLESETTNEEVESNFASYQFSSPDNTSVAHVPYDVVLYINKK